MFKHSPVAPRSSAEAATTFYFVDNRLVVKLKDDVAVLPQLSLDSATKRSGRAIDGIGEVEIERDLFLGTLDGKPCRLVELRPIEGRDRAIGAARPEQTKGGADEAFSLMGLRSLMGRFDDELLKVAGVASQILDWDRNHQYCGRCGTPTRPSEKERSRTCPNCSLTAYPRISPAIIVAVLKGDKILLGHNRRHRESRVFSVLAGFVEPGESLEECVQREVMEEAAIELQNITYFASQPWPFPDSLMVAFTAEYKSGEINVDGDEIMEADWFDKDHLPSIPPHGTIARRLIDWFAVTRSSSGSSS